MSPHEAAKLFREKADMYLEMTGSARGEQQRRLLHELFEENEAQAELLEETIRSNPCFNDFRLRRRMN
jgi:hypothetical protein